MWSRNPIPVLTEIRCSDGSTPSVKVQEMSVSFVLRETEPVRGFDAPFCIVNNV